jgi:hypothetical protein
VEPPAPPHTARNVALAILGVLLAVEIGGGGSYVYLRLSVSAYGVARTLTPTVVGPAAGPEPGPRQSSPSPSSPSLSVGSTRPPAVGLVVIDPAVTDSRAVEVATVLNTYFTAINVKDFDRALSVYDPAGVINPSKPADANHFRQGVSTTVDTDVVLRGVSQDASPGAPLLVWLTFRSQQEPGFGPKGRENERCTRWDVTHEMSVTASATYRIVRSINVTNATC